MKTIFVVLQVETDSSTNCVFQEIKGAFSKQESIPDMYKDKKTHTKTVEGVEIYFQYFIEEIPFV